MSMPQKVEVIDVLLVEDDPGDVLLIQEAFADNKLRNQLHHVSDGVEALAFLRREGASADVPQPDLVLLDLNLPGIDGRQVLARMKSDPDLRRIPVVVLTTSPSEDDIIHAYDQHVNSYIRKPVDLDRFLQVLRAIDDYWLGSVSLPPR
jgi:two-component system, chemotaxis family, response regulator Rcp1